MKSTIKRTTSKDKPRTACGIFGVFEDQNASVNTYYGLHSLQHRGQEAAGIVSSAYNPEKKRTHFNIHKGMGLVTDVFRDYSILKEHLNGTSAIGHTRYSTSGSANNEKNIQPLIVNYRNGNLAIVHNLNLTNFLTIRK